jgi:hypothetical protein
MDIDNLTVGQLKEIRVLLGESAQVQSTSNLYSRYIGKYVICRSRNEGVNAGTVVQLDNTGVIMKDSRRLFYHKPINKNISWYEGVAKIGISEDSKVGPPVEKIIVEDYSLTLCSNEAKLSIKNIKNNAQS